MSINQQALEAMIENSGVKYRKGAVSYYMNCPRCGKKEKLAIKRKTGAFICFVCNETEGFRGRAEFALVEFTGIPFREIRERLYGTDIPIGTGYIELALSDFWDEFCGEEIPLQPSVEFEPDVVELTDPRALNGVKYLHNRGISLELADEYRLRFNAKSQRVVFPVYDGERLIGWQGRTIRPTSWVDKRTGEIRSSPKALTSEGLKRENTLMFQNRMVNSGHVVLCEGPIDAIKAHLCGGNVATLGKAVSQVQLSIIRNSGIGKVYLALDPDAAKETYRICKELGDLELYRLLPAKGFSDLGEMTPEAVYERFVTAPRINPGHLILGLR